MSVQPEFVDQDLVQDGSGDAGGFERQPTVSASLLWAFMARSPARNRVRIRQIVAEEGIEFDSLFDSRTRIPSRLSNRLLEEDLEVLGDPLYGVRVGLEAQPGTFGMVERLARCAPTLRKSIQCYVRYAALVQESAETHLIEQGDLALVTYRANERQSRVVTDFTLSYSKAMLCRHVRGGLDAEAIDLTIEAPEHAALYSDLLGVPVRFNRLEDAIVLRRSDLSRPMVEASEEAHASLERRVQASLARLVGSGCFETRVTACIRRQLERGGVSLEQTADLLFTSGATLRRRLARVDTSYQQILDEVRASIAKRELLNQRYSPAELATRLGFTHQNGFYKAFKRWTGISAREWRTFCKEERGSSPSVAK